MTDEQLQQIRERVAWRNSQFTVPHDQLPTSAHTDAEALLAEVERLQAIEAAQRETIAYAEQLERVDVAMLGIIQDLAAEVPDWHDAVRLNGEAVTFLAERAGETLNKRREELDAQNAAMRELVQWVAALDPVSDEARDISGVPSGHRYADKITKARAILAGNEAHA